MLSTYHFPGIADIVGLLPNFSQFVYMPGQWGVHRDCNDLAAQGNATVGKKASIISLHTDKAPKQYVHKKYWKLWRGQLLSVLSEQKDVCLSPRFEKNLLQQKRKNISVSVLWLHTAHDHHSPLPDPSVFIYCQFKFKLRTTQQNAIWLWGREDGGSKWGAVLTLKLKQKFIFRWRMKNWNQTLENLPDVEERLERISATLAVESLLSLAADKNSKQDSSAFFMFSECSSKTMSGAQRTANVQTCIPDSIPEDVLPHQLKFWDVLIMYDICVEGWFRQQVGPGKGWVHKSVPWKIKDSDMHWTHWHNQAQEETF